MVSEYDGIETVSLLLRLVAKKVCKYFFFCEFDNILESVKVMCVCACVCVCVFF